MTLLRDIFAIFGLIMLIGLSLDAGACLIDAHGYRLRNAWNRARAWQKTPRWQRQRIKQAMAYAERMAAIKAPIVEIGDLQRIEDPQGKLISVCLLTEWRFDMTKGAIPHRVAGAGTVYLYGYTAAELAEIHAHRADWAPIKHPNE